MKRWLVFLFIILVLVGVIGSGWLYSLYDRWTHQWKYPYGWSHSCDKQLMVSLWCYADLHGSAFPAGEVTPEASLCLLYPEAASAEVLRGKTVPLDVVEAILEKGGRLGPDTCGWHYVEGLRLDDDPGLALCWDKIGLGHNGERLSQGGHFVIFVGQDIKYIPGAKWQEFLEEQEKLLAECKKKRQKQRKK